MPPGDQKCPVLHVLDCRTRASDSAIRGGTNHQLQPSRADVELDEQPSPHKSKSRSDHGLIAWKRGRIGMIVISPSDPRPGWPSPNALSTCRSLTHLRSISTAPKNPEQRVQSNECAHSRWWTHTPLPSLTMTPRSPRRRTLIMIRGRGAGRLGGSAHRRLSGCGCCKGCSNSLRLL